MQKLVAILNVIAWSGFWAFGYLAISAPSTDARQITIAALLAAAGAGAGLVTYFQLIRHSEATGYAKKPNRVPEHKKTNGEIA